MSMNERLLQRARESFITSLREAAKEYLDQIHLEEKENAKATLGKFLDFHGTSLITPRVITIPRKED